MPFIEAGDKCRAEYGNVGPPKAPPGGPRLGKRFSPGAEQEEAEQAVADYVPCFSQEVVPRLEVRVIDAEQEMKNRVENAAGVLPGQVWSRLDGDDDQPEEGGDPCFQSFALMRIQAGRESTSLSFTKCGKDRAPRT